MFTDFRKYGVRYHLEKYSITLMLVFIHGFVYVAINHLYKPPFFYRLQTSYDAAIPFDPRWVWPYIFIYITPVALAVLLDEIKDVYRFMAALLLLDFMDFCIFFAYPVFIERPVFAPQTVSEWMMGWVYFIDTPGTCFPSHHVAFAALLSLVGFTRGRGMGLIMTLIGVAISASTLLTKQHYIWDVAAGAIIACVAFFSVYKAYPYTVTAGRHYLRPLLNYWSSDA